MLPTNQNQIYLYIYLNNSASYNLEENKLLHCHDTRQKNYFHMYSVLS